MQSEVKKYTSVEAMDEEIEDLVSEGGSMLTGYWEVKRQNEKGAQLTHHAGVGNLIVHLILFIIFGWWTFCVSNIVYGAAYYYMYTTNLNMQVKPVA